MRTSLLVAVGFAFVASSAVIARSQEVDVTLINDVETSPNRNATDGLKPAIRSRSKAADAAKAKSKQAAANEGDDLDAAIRSTAKHEEPAKADSNQPAAKESGDQATATALPATLDEALAQALRSNPEVLLAEATMRQAQAEYNQAKLKAVQDVTVSFHQWKAQQYKVEVRRAANKRIPGSTPEHEIRQLTSEFAETEAKLAYLMGGGAELHPADPSVRKAILTPMGTSEKIYVFSRDSGEAVAKAGAADKAAAYKGAVEKRAEIPEKYRKILQKPMKVKFAAMPLAQVIEQLNQTTGDELPILRQTQWQFDLTPLNVELTEELPLQTVLEMVADLTGCMFIFRDYGLLVAPRNSPFQYPRAASIPEGAAGF